jgi:hypothetical protein
MLFVFMMMSRSFGLFDATYYTTVDAERGAEGSKILEFFGNFFLAKRQLWTTPSPALALIDHPHEGPAKLQLEIRIGRSAYEGHEDGGYKAEGPNMPAEPNPASGGLQTGHKAIMAAVSTWTSSSRQASRS